MLWLILLVVLSAVAFLTIINTQTVLQWAFSELSRGLSASQSSTQVAVKKEVLRAGEIRGRLFGPIKLDDLLFETPDIRVHAARLNIEWQPTALLYGNINILSLVVNNINISLLEPSSGNTITQDDVDAYIDDLDKLLSYFPFDIDSAVFRNIRILQAHSSKVALIDEIKFSSRMRSDGLYVDSLQVLSPSYAVSVAGVISTAGKLALDASAQWQPETDAQAIRGELKLQGDTSILNVSVILAQPGKLEFNGIVKDPAGEAHWSGRLNVKGFNYGQYLSSRTDTDSFYLNGAAKVRGDLESVQMNGLFRTSLPDIGVIDAQLDLQLTEHKIDIKQATITQPDSTANVRIQGELSMLNEAWLFDGQSQWQDVQWPLTGPPEFTLPTGEIQGRISETAYELALSKTAVQYKDHSLHDLSATIDGNKHALNISELNTRHYDATITGSAKIDWRSALSWDATLQGHNINPGNLNGQWPGSVSATLSSRGKYQDKKFDTKIQIHNSAGTLRDKPFKAHGTIHISDDTYSSDGLELVLGDTRLSATGSIADQWDLKWTLAQADIALLLPGSTGKFSSAGKITGEFLQPLIIGQLTANNIDIDGQQKADLVTADMNIDLSGKKHSSFLLVAKNFQYLDYQVGKFEIKVNGTQADHQINVMAKSANDIITLSLRGDLENDKDLLWVGRLTKGKLHTDLAGNWTLLSDAPLRISKNLFQFDESCWSGQQARWCAETGWQKGQNLDANATFVDVPLSLFQPLLHEQLQIKGLLNGTAEIHAAEQGIDNAKVTLNIDTVALQMKVEDEMKRVTSVQSGQLDYEQTANNIGGKLALQFSDSESLTAAIKLSSPNKRSAAIQDWPVEAYIKAHSQHPDFIRLFYTAIGEISGTWQSDITLRGTLNKPVITGSSLIRGPLITLPDAGLALREVKLGIHSVADNTFNITGGFSSGSGSIDIDGKLISDPSQDWPIELKVSGDHVQVLNVGKTTVDVSPNLQLKKTAERIDVSGSVEISRAQIIAAAGLSESVKMSNDVIFVDEEVSAQEVSKRDQSPLQVYSNVNLILSDDVYFNGYGLSGRLVGSVKVQGEPGKTTTGQGAFHIREGRYKAFGVTLDLDIGRLIYANDPVDNPAINARASSRSGDITAGFRITGYLTDPEINVYSIPSMPDSEALSYLLFGKKVDDTSFGRDSFDSLADPNSNTDGIKLGDALNPNGYIDYIVGLMNSETVLRVRFELNKNWELYTESSINHRGAEIVYTFEK